MKKIISSLAVTIMMASSMITGCQSSSSSEKLDSNEVKDIKSELVEVNQNNNVASENNTDEAEWKAFKIETEIKISDNNILIEATRVKMKKSGKVMDALYEKRINELESKNKGMQNRLDFYEANHSDWVKFKTEFNHDMDELGKALKDLTVKNV